MEQISKALKGFQSDLPEVKMDAEVTVQTRTGGSYKFKYATLANIIKTVLPRLNEFGLSFSQTFDESCVVTTLHHESGEHITSKVPCDFSNGTMQEIGSRISYLKRYGLSAMLGIVGEEDDDANIADGNEYKKSQPKKQAKTDGEITEPQKKKLWAMMKSKGMNDKEAAAFFNFKNPKGKFEASDFIENFELEFDAYKRFLDGDDIPY